MLTIKRTMHKGLTLIEVIVAVALISMVTSFLLINLSRSYAMLASAKGLTSDIFNLVQTMELDIQNAQMSLADGATPTGTMESFTLFAGSTAETKVEAYRVENSAAENSSWEFFAYVPEKGIPALPVPEITELKIAFYNGDSDRVSYPNPDLTARRSSYDYIDDHNVFRNFTYQWYVSREGFTAVNYDNRDSYHELLYPIYPTDYQIIAGANTNSLNVNTIEEYKGRHILVVARPVATSGKMGSRFQSQPVYISALPVTFPSPLYFHFETGMIDQETIDPDTVPISQWTDLQNHTWTASNASNKPELTIGESGSIYSEDDHKLVFVQYLNFTGQPMTTTIHEATPEALTVFALVRQTSAESSLDVIDVNDDTLSLIEDPDTIGKWRIMSGIIFPEDNAATTINIGGSGQDILEVVAYKGVLSEAEELQVRQYLSNKYGL